MRDEHDFKLTLTNYADTVNRICIIYLKNSADAEDIFQNVFLKYYNSSIHFNEEEHKKAWLIRVTINECKNLLKNFFRKNTVSIEAIASVGVENGFNEDYYVTEAVLKLPEKYRTIIYLHYYEGYSAVEIGKMLGRNVNTIYTLLARGRAELRAVLGGNEHEW